MVQPQLAAGGRGKSLRVFGLDSKGSRLGSPRERKGRSGALSVAASGTV